MSLGGCYLEMNQDVFHHLIQQNKSLQEYVNKNSLKSCTLEQSWDSVRILTQNFSPNILGSSPLSNVDLGEACFLFSSSDIQIINQQLSSIDDSILLYPLFLVHLIFKMQIFIGIMFLKILILKINLLNMSLM